MAAEEEARGGGAGDGEEVQVEPVDIGTAVLRINLDGKLQSNKEIDDERQIMDSNEGILKITEDQDSQETSQEHSSKCSSSSLNVHKEEVEISNENPQENEQKDAGLPRHENDEPKEHDEASLQDHLMNHKTVHEERCPEDDDIANHTHEIAQLEDQQSKRTDNVDADAVREEIPTIKETDLPKNVPETEQAEDELTNDAQVVLDQEPPGTRQLQNQGSVEETIDPEEVDTENSMRQSCVGLEEAIPEDHVATTEPSEEIDGVEDAKAEETSNDIDAAFTDDAIQDKEVSPIDLLELLEQEETSNLAEEHGVAASEPQVTLSEEVVKDTEATEAQDITDPIHAVSEEVATEDNSASSEPSNDDIQQALEQGSDSEVTGADTRVACDVQEVHNVASEEEIKHPMAADNIVEENALTSKDISRQKVRGLETEEIKNTQPVAQEEASDPAHASSPFSDVAQEDIAPSETPRIDATLEANQIEATSTEEKPQESNASLSDDPTPEDSITAIGTANDTREVDNVRLSQDIEGSEDIASEEISGKINGVLDGEADQGTNEHASEPTADMISDAGSQELQEQDPAEFRGTEATEPGGISPEITAHASEDVKRNVILAEESSGGHAMAIEENVYVHPELEELKNTEPVETQDHVTASDLPEQEEVKDTGAMENEAVHGDSTAANISELTEDVETIAVLADDAAPDEHVLEVEEIKNTGPVVEVEDDTSASEVKGTEAMETEPILHESTVASISELTEAVKSNVLAEEAAPEEHAPAMEAAVDMAQVQEPELEETKITEPVEVKDNITASDLQAEESVEDDKFTDSTEHQRETQQCTCSDLAPTEENIATAEPTSDIQEQNVCSAREIMDSEDAKTEKFSEQSILHAPEVVVQESALLGSDLASNDQQVQEWSSTKETTEIEALQTEDHQQHKVSTPENSVPENTPTEGEINVDSHKVQEDISAVEVKDIGAMESEEIAAQESNDEQGATIEVEGVTAEDNASYDLEDVKDMKITEAINAEEISCQKPEAVILEDPSQTHNGTAVEEHPVESNGETLGNKINNVELVNEKIKDEMQELTEQKEDESSGSGETTVFQDQKDESTNEEDDATIYGEDTTGASIDTEQTKEELEAVNEHDSTQMLSSHGEDNIAHDQDSDIKAELFTERGTAEAFQDSAENSHQAAQDVAEEDDTTKSGDHPDDQGTEQLHDVVFQTQVRERSAEAFTIEQQDETVQKVNLDQQQKEEKEIEEQTEEIQTDEQKHDGNNADFTTEPLSAAPSIDIDTTSRKDDDDDDVIEAEQKETVATEMLKNEQTRHIPLESFRSIGDAIVENSTETKEGTEEESASNSAVSLHAVAENYDENEEENTGKDAQVTKASTDVDGATDENRNEEVEDEKLETTEHNAAEGEDMHHRVEPLNSDRDNDDILPRNTLPEHDNETGSDTNQTRQDQQTIKAHDAAQLEPEKVAVDRIAETDSNEKTETGHTAITEAVKLDEAVCDKASHADRALSDETFETSRDAESNLDASPPATASKGESMNDEDDIHEEEVGDTQNEAENSDLPVSNFLMNLIMGKESNDPDGNPQLEDGSSSCCITPQQEEILPVNATENKVDGILISEQEKPEETHDLKLEACEELSQNTHDLGASVHQHNAQDEISDEHVEEAIQIQKESFKINTDGLTIPKACQENSSEEGRTELLHESLPEDRSFDAVIEQPVLSTEPDMGAEKKLPDNSNDLQSPLSTNQEESTESSIIEAKTNLEVEPEIEATTKIENLHENSQNGPGSEATSDDQKPEITGPVSSTETNLVHRGKEISAGSECMEEKEIDKFSTDELGGFAKTLSDGLNLHINQDKQDDSADNQIVMEKNLLEKPKQSSLLEQEAFDSQVQERDLNAVSAKEAPEIKESVVEIIKPELSMDEEQSPKKDEPDMAEEKTYDSETIDEQEAKDFTDDPTIRTLEQTAQKASNHQERDLDAVSAKEAPEIKESVMEMIKPEFSMDEEQSPKKDEPEMAEEKTYDSETIDEEEAKDFTDDPTIRTQEQTAQQASNHQERDLDAVSAKEPSAAEENFVYITKPGFSTDEEQSPKKDEPNSNMAEDKSYDQNFTDEADSKIEEQGAGLKTSPRKHNILSGVGSKVKHQLAKVKKAIIGKPGNAKSVTPKS